MPDVDTSSLERSVENACAEIDRLRDENADLRTRLQAAEQQGRCLNCQTTLHGDGQCAPCTASEVFGHTVRVSAAEQATRASERLRAEDAAHAIDEQNRLRQCAETAEATLQAAEQQLAYWWQETGRCPCGARRESPQTHAHVCGCPTELAVRQASGGGPSDRQGAGRDR